MSIILESEVLNVSGRPVRVLKEHLTIKQVAQEIANVRDVQVSQIFYYYKYSVTYTHLIFSCTLTVKYGNPKV